MTDNRYSSLLDNQDPAATDPRAARGRALANKYDALIRDDDSTKAQVNVLEDSDPETAARANRYARTLGVPPRLAQDDIKNFDAMDRQRRVAAAAADHPNIGRFMADPRAAAVSHDDTPAMRQISNSFQSFWNRPKPKQSWLQWARDLPSNIAGSIGAGLYGASEGVTQALIAAGEVRNQIDPFAMLDRAIRGDAAVKDQQAGLKNVDNLLRPLVNTQRAEAARLRPKDQGFVGDALYSGIESIPTSLAALGAGLAGAPGVGLGALGLTTGGTSYGQARDAKLSPVEAANFAVSQAGIEVLTERIPVLKFLEDTKVGTPFFKRLGKNLAAEQVGEQAATALQDFNQWALIDVNKGKTFGEYLRERPEAAAQTALAVAATVGSTNIAIEAGQRTVNAAGRIAAARQDATALSGIVDAAAKSKLRQRDPEAFRQFVEQTAEDGDSGNVYIPAEAIDTFMQSEGFEDADGFFEELRGQLDEARATGGDVVVPVADVATRLAGTPAWEALKDDARMDAGGLSMRQAVDEGAEVQKQIDTRGAEILQQSQDQATADEPVQAVYEDVKNKLLAIGQPARVAEHNAAVFAANREAWGARLGQTAEEYHAANPVEFTRGSFDTSGANVMDQSTTRIYRGGADGTDSNDFAEQATSMPELTERRSEGNAGGYRGLEYAAPGNPEPYTISIEIDTKGKATLDLFGGGAQNHDDMSAANSLGPATVRAIARELKARYPQITSFAGDRVSGAGKGRMQIVRTFNQSLLSVEDQQRAVAMRMRDISRAHEREIAKTLTGSPRDREQQLFDKLAEARDADPEWQRLIAESRALSDQRTPIVGAAPRVVAPKVDPSTVLVGSEQRPADASSPDVEWSREDLINEGSAASALKQYGRGKGIAYEAWVSLDDIPKPSGSGIRKDGTITDRGGYSWDELRSNRTAPPPATITIRPNGKIVINDGNHRLAFWRDQGHDVVPAFVIDERAGASALDFAPQVLNQGPRGQIALYGDRSVITLFERSDLSTLIHETGHLFLDELYRNAKAKNAPQDVRDDWATVEKWFAENGAPVTGDAVPREAHELWARGFERYAMEGKAPSSALQRAFAAFRGWLLRIYQVVDNLRSPINPEIREVFDRLLATQDAIDSYRAQQNIRSAWTDADQAGMTGAEWAAYQASLVKAQDDAYDALLFKTMHRIRQRRTQEYREAYRRYRDEATAEIDAQPRFRLLRLLRTGKIDDREIAARVDRQWLQDRYGDDAESRLPANTRVAGEGMDGDELAELTGFASGDEAMRALFEIAENTADMRTLGDKRQFRDRLIDDMAKAAATDAGIADPLTDGTIEEEAIAAISNDTQGDVLATELRHLARRTAAAPTPYKLAREWARRKIEAGTVKDVAAKSAQQRYARAAAKAGRDFEKAIIAGDADAAFRHKQAQMLNHALFVESKNAGDEVEVIVRWMGRLASRAAMKSVDQDYFDRVHELLEKFDFRQKSQRFLDEREGFNDWAAKRIAEGFEVAIPPRLAESGDHYSRIQLTELYALRDTVDSLVALGRHKQKLLDGQAEREFAAVKASMLERLRQIPIRAMSALSFTDNTIGRNIRAKIAGGLKISTIALDMDHQDPNGPMMNLLVHRAGERAVFANQLRRDVLTLLANKLTKLKRKEWKRLNEKITIPEITFRVGLGDNDPRLGKPVTITRRELLGIALNTGNMSNFDKMTQGERWNPVVLRQVLNREMSKADWQLVQSMWDAVETLWPHIVTTERALSGVVPEKVTSTPIDTPHGIFKGGYWPVVYDPARSKNAEANAEKAADDMFGRMSGLATPKGHTITRTEATGPMVYNLDQVLFRHVDRVITRIAYAEYARDVMRVINDRTISGEIDLRLGAEYRKEIPLWLRDQILPVSDDKGSDFADALLRHVRLGTIAVGMGLRFSTGVAQVSGLMSSVARLGGKETPRLLYHVSRQVVAGVGNMVQGKRSEIHEFVFERSALMRERLRENSVEVERSARKLRGKHTAMDNINVWMMWHIGMVDLHIVSIPTWITGYRQAIERGMTETQASKFADQMVATSQGSGRKDHLSRWQRSQSEFKKIFFLFYTPFNVIFNAQWEAARAAKRGDFAKTLNIAMFMLIAQTLMDAFLSGDLPKGDDDDPDDDYGISAWASWASRNAAFGLFSGVPIVRDAASAAERKIAGQYSTFGGIPTSRLMEDTWKSGGLLYEVAQGEKEFGPKAIPGLANVIGVAAHAPLGQPGTTAKFLWQYERGEVNPETPIEWYYGVTKGKLPEDKK